MLHAIFAALKAGVVAVATVVWAILKLGYRVLKFLRIRVLTLYVVVMAILSCFFPVFGAWRGWFWSGFALCLLLTLLSWGLCIRKKLRARPHDIPKENEEEGRAEHTEPTGEEGEKSPEVRYFDVEGRPEYFFAEYEDRYELYYRGEEGAEYIRTDYKQRES